MTSMALALILLLQGAAAARPGVVAGQLKTVAGAPAVAIRIVAVPAPTATVRPSEGQEYYSTQNPVSTALTDTQGRYRLTDIPPGRYYIMAGSTYYPSTVNPDAARVITVGPGSTTDNTDFALLGQLGGKVSGHVTPKLDTSLQTRAVISGGGLEGFVEVPVSPDGAFDFGRVPTGAYLIDLYPTPPGMAAFRVRVGDKDTTDLNLVRPPTHTVSGRIVVQNGPLPRAILEFHTLQSHVNVKINPDGTFSTPLHSARHRIEMAGMPGGYSIASVRAGSEDVSQGLVVGNADVSGVVITIAAPRVLPHLRGKVTGLSNARLSSAKVEVTGPIVGSLETAVRPDGSFEFATTTPGMYSLRLLQVPELKPMNVVVSWEDTDVQVVVPAR
jgi:hypothetical protein